jgi:hypothetical protein
MVTTTDVGSMPVPPPARRAFAMSVGEDVEVTLIAYAFIVEDCKDVKRIIAKIIVMIDVLILVIEKRGK